MRLLVVPQVRGDAIRHQLDDFAIAAPLMRRITDHLDEHRVVGTAIEVSTPYYQGVSVAALVHAGPGRPAGLVRQRAIDALTRYINPLTGGPDGTGWPFDADLNAAAVTQLLETVDGVERVEEALLFEYDLRTGRRLGSGKDVIRLDGHSLFLSAPHQVVVQMTSLVPGARRRCRPGGDQPRRSPQWLLNQLPVGMLDGDFFVRFVSIFQELGATLLEDADNIEHLADVSVAPDAMVRWLGVVDRHRDDRPVPRRRGAAPHRGRRRDDADLARHRARAAALPRADQRRPGRGRGRRRGLARGRGAGGYCLGADEGRIDRLARRGRLRRNWSATRCRRTSGPSCMSATAACGRRPGRRTA